MPWTDFASQTKKEILNSFQTAETGLTEQEAKKRLIQYGPNQIVARKLRWWRVFGRQFKSPFIYLLFAAIIIAFALGEIIDGLMILSFIIINTILGFAQEYHSEKSIELLKKYVVSRAKIIRDGKETLINAAELVPGDLILIENGDVVPADLRLIDAENLLLNESNLTGEPTPVMKNAAPLSLKTKSINDASNILFSSTAIASGNGLGVVIATGKKTVMGEVTKLTVETNRESNFEKGIAKFSKFILKMILIILLFVFLANLLIKKGETSWAEMALFSIALAVSVIPEALPVVTTMSLSRGSMRLAKNKVVVKRLSAVEDLGSIEVLCTDKTGTITENKLTVAEINAENSSSALFYAALASSFLGQGKRETNNSFDIAIWQKLDEKDKKLFANYTRTREIPFDPERRRNCVVVKEKNGEYFLISRGAGENILPLCSNINKEKQKELFFWLKKEGLAGRRAIAIAEKKIMVDCKILEEEKNLNFIGIISFEDPIKPSARYAIEQAKKMGVEVKILTGDAKEVATAVALKIGLIKNLTESITGDELEKMPEEKQLEMVAKYDVFARVSPKQKYEIIRLLQHNKEVGFLGEGINDAPALKLANVALVVESASDIARDAADIVLLKKSLAVIIDGIKIGREIFANTIKYLKITLISNFGNFYALAVASLIITFLPMLPAQILLLNLLSDFPMIAIAMDNVDTEELRRPRIYNIREVTLMAIIFGLVSTFFDFIFFAIFYQKGPSVLQTNWFIGSVLTELALIYSIRTKLIFWKARRPSFILSGLCIAAVAATIILPLSHFGKTFFKFTAPTPTYFLLTISVAAAYFILTEIIKKFYYKTTTQKETAETKLA